jgi:hypothetical protein
MRQTWAVTSLSVTGTSAQAWGDRNYPDMQCKNPDCEHLTIHDNAELADHCLQSQACMEANVRVIDIASKDGLECYLCRDVFGTATGLAAHLHMDHASPPSANRDYGVLCNETERPRYCGWSTGPRPQPDWRYNAALNMIPP